MKLSDTIPGGTLAMTRTSVDLVFSEPVRQTTAEKAFSITPPVEGSFHWQGPSTLIFTPSAKLPLSASFTVHVAAGVQDSAGNTQSKTGDLTFTTVGQPVVTAVAPQANSQNVPVDAQIQITFDRFVDEVNVLAGLSIQPDTPFSASWKGPTLTITPNNPLSFSTVYLVRVGAPAVDTDGTPIGPFTVSFVTVDMGLRVDTLVPAPHVAGASVRTPIAVVFDGPIDPSTIADAIQLTPPVSGKIQIEALPDDRQPTASPVPTAPPSPSQSASASASPGIAASPSPAAPPTPAPTQSPAAGQNVLVFTPDSPLAAHTTYTVTVGSGIRKTNGQAAPRESWSFTTGEPPASGQNQIVFVSDRSGVANVWMMNPDGSNQRQVTAELVPVSGYDVSGDGNTIAYSAGGVVKKMSIGGDNLQVLTPNGDFEYAPTITPDGTAVIVGRRDATGADQGYWRIPMVSGADPRQVAADGAPDLGSVTLDGDGLMGPPGAPAWASRAALSTETDGQHMLLVRGSDGKIELVDMAGATAPIQVGLIGNSRPIWDAKDNAFYVVGSPDAGTTWSEYRVSLDGSTTRITAAVADIAISSNGRVALTVHSPDGSVHLAYAASAGSLPSLELTRDVIWSEGSPSFSPDGSLIVFGRFGAKTPKASGGIWIVSPDGHALMNLSVDGAYPRWMP
jgi:hypothetical protein